MLVEPISQPRTTGKTTATEHALFFQYITFTSELMTGRARSYLRPTRTDSIAACARAYAATTPPAPHELVLEPGYLGAQATDEVNVLGDVVVHVQGVAGGVRLDVLGAVGVLEGVERFLEGRRGAAAFCCESARNMAITQGIA